MDRAHRTPGKGEITSVPDPERLASQHPELYQTASPEEQALVPDGEEPIHESSLSDVALEALRTGLYPDPGASMPTPDQSEVDAIGRAYGLTNEDDGALISSEELIERRDTHRWDAEPLPPK